MDAVAVQNSRTRQQWAEIINADWRKSIESIIQTGRDLEQAAHELHGEFSAMVKEDLPFSLGMADKLRRIARHPAIANSSAPTSLPPSWTVLSELTKLGPEDFADAQQRGLISEKTNMRTARAISGVYDTPAGETWGADTKPSHLPPPSEARDIARKTGRMVAASDGNVYSGASEEEEADHVRRRQQTYGIRDAVELIADSGMTADEWIAETESHWLHDFRLSSIDAAIEWLGDLRTALAEKQGVVDAQ